MTDQSRLATFGWVRTVPLDAIGPGKYLRHQIDGLDLLICRIGDGVQIVENLCSHLQQPLDRGRLRGTTITCPVHGGVFDICSGAPLKFPAGRPIRVFRAKLIAGVVYVEVPKPAL